MKTYKDSENVRLLGSSDISTLHWISNKTVGEIHMGGDGHYTSYICQDGETVPDYYTLAGETNAKWIWIYDDDQRVANIDSKLGGNFSFYVAGHSLIIKEA